MRRALITLMLAAAGASIVVAVGASASVHRGGYSSPRSGPAGSGKADLTAGKADLTADVAAGRLATAKYATDLNRAKAAGYGIITRMIPNMGFHFMNPSVKGFNVRKPPILVYERRGHTWQLGALEWVFTSKPAKPPLPGAKYGVFGAACHYVDGTLVFQTNQSKCAPRSPQTGAKFNFWHPRLITLHFWIWYPNPAGIYSGTNPMVAPFNHG
jgi:hypothetical protein